MDRELKTYLIQESYCYEITASSPDEARELFSEMMGEGQEDELTFIGNFLDVFDEKGQIH